MDDQARWDGIESLGRRLAEALLGGADPRPNTASAFLAGQHWGEGMPRYAAAVDGSACACGGRNGVVLTILAAGSLGGGPVGITDDQVMVTLFDHRGELNLCAFTPEQAKQLVNRLGEAIAASEAAAARP